MKGDFSRSTFDPAQHFTSVRMQQGRMQLDADWNEQMDILLYLLRAQAKDLLGAYGAPDGTAGFAVAAQETGEGPADLSISTGRYYVDGILVQNEDDTLFSAQPCGRSALLPENAQAGDRFVVYLDVWERHLSGAEAPALLEPALNGLDTTTRVQTTWQVKLWRMPSEDAGDLSDSDEAIINVWQASLKQEMRPTASVGRATLQPRVATAGYGLTNQLYRVEIHNAEQQPTFKWSRDNGSVTFAVASLELNEDKTLLTVTVEDQPADRQLRSDDWLELSDASFESGSQPGLLFQVTNISDRNPLTVELSLAAGAAVDDQNAQNIRDIAARFRNPQFVTGQTRPILRRWDYHTHAPGAIMDKDGALQAQEDQWLPLENGIEVRFQNTNLLRAGDYWLLPARSKAEGYTLLWKTAPLPTADGDAATGQAAFTPMTAKSINHHYAPLAILSHDGAQWQVSDRRTLFRALPRREAEEAALDRQLKTAIDNLRNDLDQQTVGTLAVIQALQDELTGSVTYQVAEAGVTLEPGQVAALDPATGGVLPATRDNATLVIGVVQEPIEQGVEASGKRLQNYVIAQRGRQQCCVTGRVEPGDLLVSSDTPGYAVAAGLYIQPGTVIGKALQGHRPTDAGQRAAITIIVTLQ